MLKNKLAQLLLGIVALVALAGVVCIGLTMSSSISILKNTITLSSDTYTKVYDGKSVENQKYQLTEGSLYEGDTIEASFTATGVDCGEYVNQFTAIIKNKNGSDVTNRYKVEYSYGKVTIEKRSLTIEASTKKKNYDGTPLLQDEYRITDGSLAEGQTLDVHLEGEVVEVDSENIRMYPHVYAENGKDVSSNYKITSTTGILVVNPIPLSLESKSMEVTYSGEELFDDSTIPFHQEGELLDGDTLIYTPEASLINAGTIPNSFRAEVVDENNTNVSHHYQINKKYGDLTILKLEVQYKTKSDEVDYTGATFDSLALGLEYASSVAQTDSLYITYLGNFRYVGEYDNKISVRMKNKLTNVDTTENYSIIIITGIITINPKAIEVKTLSAEKLYDGKDGSWKDSVTNAPISNPFIISNTVSVASGDYYTPTVLEYPLEAGTYTNRITIQIYDSEQNNVTKNYSIQYVYGELTIQKRELTIKTSSACKAYDGLPLVSTNWYLLSGTTALDEYLYVEAIGTQTTVGISENDVLYRIVDSNGTELSNAMNNYSIQVIKGNLQVYPGAKHIVISPKDVVLSLTDFTASGEAKLMASEISGFEDYQGQYTITCEFEGSIQTVGIGESRIKDGSVIIKDSLGNVDTSSFDISYSTGILQIYMDSLTIVTTSQSKEYDGTAITGGLDLANSTLKGAPLNIVDSGTNYFVYKDEGEEYKVKYALTGKQTIPGISLNTVTFLEVTKGGNSDNLLFNYHMNVEYGHLEVKRCKLYVTTETISKSISLDNVHSITSSDISSQTITGLALGDTAYIYKACTLTENEIPNPKKNKVEIKIRNEQNEDVTSYYIIEYTYGDLILLD